MNDNVQKWVAALRSGEFKPGRQRLRNRDDDYCCLGVACEIFRRETGQGEWQAADGDPGCAYSFVLTDFERSRTYLLNPVIEWLGLGRYDGGFTKDVSVSTSLAVMNDGGASFAEIADTIESEPRGLLAEVISGLTYQNDLRSATFEDIAAIIESEPEHLLEATS